MSAAERIERVLAPFAEAGYEFEMHEDGTLTGAPAAKPAAAEPAPASPVELCKGCSAPATMVATLGYACNEHFFQLDDDLEDDGDAGGWDAW